jgi:hypothetical protein
LEACFVVRDHNGQTIAYIYYEDELRPGAISGEATHQRRGAADRGEYRQAAGVIADAVIRSVELIVQTGEKSTMRPTWDAVAVTAQ